MPLIFPNSTAEVCNAKSSPRASRTGAALAPLRLWHLASLDAPTVAVVWASGFCWAAGAHLSLQAAAVIALGVWTVYVGDRLLDARASLRHHTEYRLRERHYFHWRHRRLFVPFAVLAGAVTAILVLGCIPIVARERDSVLAAASLAYFARVHQRQLSTVRSQRPLFPPIVTKELLVGVLFAVGCALPALGTAWAAPVTTRWVLMGAVAYFAALAWLNCYAIEQWESGAERVGNLSLAALSKALSLIGLIAALLLSIVQPRAALLLAAAALSALLIALLDRTRSRVTALTLRAGADLVLLAPAIIFPFVGMVR